MNNVIVLFETQATRIPPNNPVYKILTVNEQETAYLIQVQAKNQTSGIMYLAVDKHIFEQRKLNKADSVNIFDNLDSSTPYIVTKEGKRI